MTAIDPFARHVATAVDLRSLSTRVGELAKPRRDVDLAVYCVATGTRWRFVRLPIGDEDGTSIAVEAREYPADWTYDHRMLYENHSPPDACAVPAYSERVDLVVALVGRMLPGYDWHLDYGDGATRAEIRRGDVRMSRSSRVNVSIPLLACALRCLAYEADGDLTLEKRT